jgi:hypothetical protein
MHCGGADAREQGSLDREAQGAQEVFVAEQDQGEGAAGAPSQAQEQADFLQGGSGVVLGVVEQEHEGDRIEIGEVLLEGEQVAAALEAGALAQLGQEHFEHAGGREGGLGDEQGQEPFGFEALGPSAGQGGFAGARGAGEKHDAAQGGGGVQQRERLALAGAGEEFGFLGRGGKRDHAQPPGAQQLFQGGRFGFSAHSCLPGGSGGC